MHAPGADHNNVRTDMKKWEIVVFGVVHLNFKYDYDRIQESANNDKTIRQLLGDVTFVDIYTNITIPAAEPAQGG